MQFASQTNQISSAAQGDSRYVDLRVWMLKNRVTFPMMGKSLGITSNGVQQLLKSRRIAVARYREFIDLGVPSHLLPAALDVPRGKRPGKR